MLLSLSHLCGPLLDLPKQVPFSVALGSPSLDTALQIWSHCCWVEKKDHGCQPAGDAFPDAAQDTVGLPCCKGTLLPYSQLDVHQDPQVLLCKAAFQLVGPQPIRLCGVTPFSGAELHTCLCGAACGSSLPISATHRGSYEWQHLHSSHFCWGCNLPCHPGRECRGQMVLVPVLTPECTVSDWPSAGLGATDHSPLNLAVQTAFIPCHCLFI